MGVDYAWEKYFSALRYAVGSTAPLQERLAYVISEVHHLQSDSFPNAEIWVKFEELIWKTTHRSEENVGEGTIQATTSQMTDADAAEYLRKAFDIFSEFAELYGKK
jgi:hypothetical protein